MRNILISLLFFLLLMIIAEGVNAANLTWTNGGGDNLASNPANWSGGIAPQNGDIVVFDGTSADDCTWDLPLVSASFSINQGYTGTVTLNVNLEVAKVVTWTGLGGNDLASNPANWSGNIVPQNGDKVIFNDTSPDDCIWDINVAPSLFSINSTYTGTVTLNTDISITGSLTVAGGILNLNDKNLYVEGYLLIGTNGTLNASSSTIEVKGDWTNAGNFIPGTSTVILSGTNQTIYGNTTFYNLTKTVTSADTLYFEAGSTQTIVNSLTLQGANGELLSLRSTVDGQQWYIDPQGTRNISFASIKDMNNINFVNIVPANSDDAGNNSGASFPGSECVCFKEKLMLAQIIKTISWKKSDSGLM